MDDCHQILYHFLFWTERFLIEYHYLTLMGGTEMGHQVIAKADQSVVMGNDEGRNLTCDNSIHQVQELRAFEVQSPTNFRNPFIHCQSACRTKLLQCRALVFQVWALRLTGDTQIHDDLTRCGRGLDTSQPQGLPDMIIGILPSIAWGAKGGKFSFPIPPLECLHRDTDSL